MSHNEGVIYLITGAVLAVGLMMLWLILSDQPKKRR
jgi:hypothetical protein